MQKTKLIISLTLLIIVLIFVAQNLTTVELSFLAWSVTLSQALLILIVFVCGLTIGALLTTLAGRKIKTAPGEQR